MIRSECIQVLKEPLTGSLVLTAAGGATHEWWNFGDNRGQLQIRTMGLASSIGLGLALALPRRQIVVLDGDGALLMNLHTLVTCAAQSPPNLLHVCFDNGIYESSGGTPTFTGSTGASLADMARAAGVRNVRQPATLDELKDDVNDSLERQVHTFIHVRVDPIRPKVPNIALDEVENKYRFVRYIEETEGISVMTGSMAGAPFKSA